MPMTYPQLRHFFGAYVYMSWTDEYATVWEAVDDYADNEPAATALPGEIDELLSSTLSDADLQRTLLDDLGCGYWAEGEGTTYREWLRAVAARVGQRAQANG